MYVALFFLALQASGVEPGSLLTTSALLTFVALDKDGKKLPVPPLAVENEIERVAAAEAQARRAERISRKGQTGQTWMKLLER